MQKIKIADLLKDQKVIAKHLEEIRISDGDVGHAYAEMASAYLKANNHLLANYNSFLKEIVLELNKLNTREKELTA